MTTVPEKHITARAQRSHRGKKRDHSSEDIYGKAVITRKITLSFKELGSNLKENMHHKLIAMLEGRCVKEGYIKPASVQMLSNSAGLVEGGNVTFETILECLICLPVEGMALTCLIKNITKAGIRAETEQQPSAVVVFVARDHNYKSEAFATLKEGERIRVKIIGIRFELNDPFISAIAELLPVRRRIKRKKIQVKKKST